MLLLQKIRVLSLNFLIIPLIVIFLATNIIASEIRIKEPTIYLPKNSISPREGYLVDFERLEKCVLCIQELKSKSETYNLEVKYLNESLRASKLECELNLTKEREERRFVEEALKQRLAEKEVWYKKPVVVMTGTALVLLGIFFAAKQVSD